MARGLRASTGARGRATHARRARRKLGQGEAGCQKASARQTAAASNGARPCGKGPRPRRVVLDRMGPPRAYGHRGSLAGVAHTPLSTSYSPLAHRQVGITALGFLLTWVWRLLGLPEKRIQLLARVARAVTRSALLEEGLELLLCPRG